MRQKATLISMTTYCAKAKVWGTEEMIVYHTQREDIINHPFVPIVVPAMSYPKVSFRPTSLKAFLANILP